MCSYHMSSYSFIFFFNATPTTEIYTLSLHDALPISHAGGRGRGGARLAAGSGARRAGRRRRLHALARRAVGLADRLGAGVRSEEHTSELQSRLHLVCRLLLEKKNKKKNERAENYTPV